MTIVKRSLSGLRVVGNKAVVIRDHDGTLLGIQARWPAIDPLATLTVADDLGLTEVDAADFTDASVVAVEPVVLLNPPIDGVVVEARACSEIVHSTTNPYDATSTATEVVYVMDGMLLDPPGN